MSSIVCNKLKDDALQHLMKETFGHVQNNLDEYYRVLAQKNAAIRGVHATHFLYEGDVYPSKPENLVRGVPNLHWSLQEEFDSSTSWMQEAGYYYIKNYFSAVLSLSSNSVVLEALLPNVLVSELKQEMTEAEFHIINHGELARRDFIQDTLDGVENIREHYATTIVKLREVLMDKLLLQG